MTSIYEGVSQNVERMKKSEKGKTLLKMLDQTFIFNVVDDETFIMDVKKGRVRFGKDGVTWPPKNWKEWSLVTRLTCERSTLEDIIEGKLKPIDAMVPDPEKPVKLHTSMLLAKRNVSYWVCQFLMLIREMKKEGYSK